MAIVQKNQLVRLQQQQELREGEPLLLVKKQRQPSQLRDRQHLLVPPNRLLRRQLVNPLQVLQLKDLQPLKGQLQHSPPPLQNLLRIQVLQLKDLQPLKGQLQHNPPPLQNLLQVLQLKDLQPLKGQLQHNPPPLQNLLQVLQLKDLQPLKGQLQHNPPPLNYHCKTYYRFYNSRIYNH